MSSAARTGGGRIIVVRPGDAAIVRQVAHDPSSFSVLGVSDDGHRS